MILKIPKILNQLKTIKTHNPKTNRYKKFNGSTK